MRRMEEVFTEIKTGQKKTKKDPSKHFTGSPINEKMGGLINQQQNVNGN